MTDSNTIYNNRKISTFLIKNILSYIDQKTILNKRYNGLNKKISNLFNLRGKKIEITHNHEIGGEQNMNKLYCEIDLEKINNSEKILIEGKFEKKHLRNIIFEIESKDQGWASVNCSSSYVDLRMCTRPNIQNNNNSEIIKNTNLVKNFKQNSYKNTIINLNLNLKNEKKEYLDLFINKNCLMQIVGRSLYPGWLCFIRKCKITLIFIAIEN